MKITAIALCCAAALSLGMPSAKADFADWNGGGVLTSIANCSNGNFTSSFNKDFHARYLPPNIATNGAFASLTFIFTSSAFNFTSKSGDFTNAFQSVTATQVARFGSQYSPSQIRITSQTPATITDATPAISLKGIIKGFSGFPGNQTCTVGFELMVFRP